MDIRPKSQGIYIVIWQEFAIFLAPAQGQRMRRELVSCREEYGKISI
jgi:hypothetical protein